MNWKRFTAFTFALLAVLLLSYQPVRAQSNVQAGSIQGVVTDPQGGVVPDAKVTITNKDTGSALESTTTSAGTFVSGSLVPGTYTVRVEAPSFKTFQSTATVLINVVTPVNAKLELGASSTVVEVTGQAVSVNTDQAQVSGSLTTQQIENLPINGRNFLDLAQLEPGVQIQDGGNFDPTKIGFSSISFGGRFGRSARISVDGVDVSDENVGTTTTGIPASAIAEFQLAQSSLDLSNDLTSGGAVNVATKSGTNSLHGEAFGLFRDSSQAAVYPAKPSFQRPQYGGDVGGAIIKDKLFFFVDGEKLLQHQQAGSLISGDLSPFTGTFPAPFHDGSALGRLDWQATKTIHAFARFSYWQNLDVGTFGGGTNYETYSNKDRTKNVVGGVDFTTGSYTHSFRAEYLKFVNVIADNVIGSSLPFASFPVSLILPGGFATGANDLAPQSTIQSDRQVKYDGSRVWGSHIFRYGVDYNRIMGWTFASFVGISPLAINFTGPTAAGLTCDKTGATPGPLSAGACPLNYTPDEVLLGNGQGSFTELQRFGKPNGGLGPDDRFGVYVGDSWKIKPNLSLTIGVRYDRDTGRTDSDLNTTQVINNFFPGFGNPVKQPNKNVAPQIGVAWDPKGDGKTVIRAGGGIYYDNIVFNDVLFDRLLRLPTGSFNATPVACFLGTGFPVVFGGGIAPQTLGGSGTAGADICSTPVGATVDAGGGTCAGITTANCIAAFQKSYQASFAGGGANSLFIPNELANGAPITTGLLDPQYRSPRAFQLNVGVQHELRPGMILSVDYLRNVGTHYLLGQDVNHGGDVAFFNSTAATNAVNAVNGFYGCPAGGAGVGCAITAGATLGQYAAAGLDSPNDLGSGNCIKSTLLPDGITPVNNPCAFGGINQNVGTFYFYRPIGRSVYNGMDIKLVQNVNHPFTHIKYLNFQATYTLSRFVNAGSTGSGTNTAGGDQDFVNNAIDDRNPLRFLGPSSLDRTHQFNFGGYADLPLGFRLGTVAHFWSPLAASPVVSPFAATTGGIYNSDFTGSGVVGNPLPTGVNSSCGSFGGSCDYTQLNVGGFMRQVGPHGLINDIANYNATIGGTLPTPAGQTLINSGLFTLAQLQTLGAVASTITPPPATQVPFAWLKQTDLEFSWVGHFWHERLTLQPSVSIFNVFNFANFDNPCLAGTGCALSGQLAGTSGSINGTPSLARPDRIGLGTGAFAFGAPRTIEWGLKLQF